MPRYKNVNGIRVQLTAEEEAARTNEETAWSNGAKDRALKNLREKRNRLLAETDYLALSDVTLSASMRTYRQDLRDLTDNLTTVDEINAVVFPTKPN